MQPGSRVSEGDDRIRWASGARGAHGFDAFIRPVRGGKAGLIEGRWRAHGRKCAPMAARTLGKGYRDAIALFRLLLKAHGDGHRPNIAQERSIPRLKTQY